MSFSDEDWREAIDSVLLSVVRLSRAVIPHMRARGGGRIINITSISAKQPVEGLVLSNALRAGVTGLARTIANELAPDNILVNCVAPGYTATDRVVDLAEAAAAREGITADAVQARTVAKIPMQRLATTEEFADVVAFLASGRASYVTGTTLQIDGGYVRELALSVSKLAKWKMENGKWKSVGLVATRRSPALFHLPFSISISWPAFSAASGRDGPSRTCRLSRRRTCGAAGSSSTSDSDT